MSATSQIWIDGVSAESLPLPDRGLEFGDGLFETLLSMHGQVPLLESHFERLKQGLHRLGFPDCAERARQCLQAALPALSNSAFTAIRLTVTRGSGPRGYVPPDPCEPRIIISSTDVARNAAVPLPQLSVVPAPLALANQPALAGIKHLNRLEQVLAARHARAEGADDALMLNERGEPVCMASSNLFAVVAGTILTPPLATAGIAGTRRRALIERWAPDLGLAVEERFFSLGTLNVASEVFCSNSLVGLRPVGQFGSRTWSSHPVMAALFERYRAELPA
ncbi:MAG: aminodeoxychorismate lyase [Pseudomonadota bacterium]